MFQTQLIKKARYYVIFVMAVFAFAAPAFAQQASFDCKSPALVDEKIICSDSTLSRMDYNLGKTYSDMRLHSDTARQALLRSDQRNWLLLRNDECGVTKETKLTDTSSMKYIDCFIAAYEERAQDLDAIKAAPEKLPAEISTPIRKSQFAEDKQTTTASPDIIHTKLVVGREPNPAWSKDGRLIALARFSSEPKQRLYAWQADHEPVALSGIIEDASKIQSLCIRDDKAILIRKVSADIAAEYTEISLKPGNQPPIPAWTPSQSTTPCGNNMDRVQIVSDNNEAVIDLGLLRWDRSAEDAQFITLKRNGKDLTITPPIKIDRRMSLDGIYVPASDSFIINIDNRPADLDREIERRWAKSNCMPFWQISAASGEAKRECIPYGAYVKRIPEPLPTKAGLFFAAGNAGLYKSAGDSTVQVIRTNISMPGLAPDQCHISFASLMPQGDKKSRSLQILNVCKSAVK